jgi:hypothetical protein
VRKVFISFWFRREGMKGFANAEVECTKPIRGMNDLQALEECLMEEKGYENIVVLNWRDFDATETVHEN